MATWRTLTLTARERQALETARDHDERPYVRERCSALLKIADGQSAHWVARQGLLRARDPDTVYGWLELYAGEGLGGLIAHQQGGPRRRSLQRYASASGRSP
jgi:hypothetical protein